MAGLVVIVIIVIRAYYVDLQQSELTEVYIANAV